MEIFISPFKQHKNFILHEINYVESPHDSSRSPQNLLLSVASWCKRNINWKKESSLCISLNEKKTPSYRIIICIIVESWIMFRITDEKNEPTLSYYAFCSASALFPAKCFPFPSFTSDREKKGKWTTRFCTLLQTSSRFITKRLCANILKNHSRVMSTTRDHHHNDEKFYCKWIKLLHS